MSELALQAVLAAGLALLLAAALSPLESLGWWAGWFRDPRGASTDQALDEALGFDPLTDDVAPSLQPKPSPRPPPRVGPKPPPGPAFVVYLSGIGSVSGEELLPREERFLAILRELLPGHPVLADVFPYAPGGQPLHTGTRSLRRLWAFLHARRGWRVATLINLRNLFQVVVSADHRYGPVYNYAVARLIARSLAKAGYPAGSGTPVALLGASGGAQVALGASTYLAASLRAPVEVVALGGVMAADPGLDAARRVHHLVGSKDWVHRAGAVGFPGRWRLFAHSPWNRALKAGRVRRAVIGPMRHAGPGAYMDDRPRGEGGASFARLSAEAVALAVTKMTPRGETAA